MITGPQLLELAVQRHRAGELAQAEQLYRQVLAADPRQVDALHLLGVLAHQRDRHAEAIDYIREALRLHPGHVEAHYNLGIMLHEQGQLDEAIGCYRRVLYLQPEYAAAYNNLGNALRGQGKLAEAVTCYQEALRREPGSAGAHNNLALALQAQGQLHEAVAHFQQALQINPNYSQAHNNLAVALRELGRPAESVMSARQAVRLQPDYADAHNNLGIGLKDQGKLAEAVSCYKEALRIKPDLAEAHNNLGNALREHEQLEEAIASYGRALRIKPDYADAHSNLGMALHEQGNLGEAIASYRRALRFKPHDAETHNNLGVALTKQGMAGEGATAYEEAIRLRPDYAEAHYNLGVAFQTQGRPEQAIACYEQAVHFKPAYTEALYNLGVASQSQGRPADAARIFRQVLSLKPDYAEAHNNLGIALKEQAQVEEAVASYQEALRLKPDLAEAHANLGNAFREQGNLKEAEVSYGEALRLRPSNGLRILRATMLPPIYQSVGEVQDCRTRLTEQVRQLHDEGIRLDLTADPATPAFLLAYQGLNDRDLQRNLARLYAAPQPSNRPVAAARGSASGRIQVGFLSRHFKWHTIGELMRGLIAHVSREEFAVTVLAVGRSRDDIAHFIRKHADRYIELPQFLPAARRLIGELALDVLLYPDIGMDPTTYSLAFDRLAPVQCVTWGHPSTTGISTMDYFLSSTLFEGAEAPQHYTETLVCLKNMPFYGYRPALPAAPKGREDFGLPPNAHLYGCPQSLFKLHPGFDPILAGVLRADPQGLVLLNQAHEPFYHYWEGLLRKRFAATLPDVVERIRFLPRLKHEDYLSLTQITDVLLDPIHFNGGNTSLKAFALGVPIVTLPGTLLKTRLTYGLYQKMQVDDCIVRTPEEYIATAVKLGSDSDYRASIRSKILAANHVLFDNSEPVLEIEEFFQQAVARARSQPPMNAPTGDVP
jgi:protein O-GlcNAc transferase